MLRTCELVVVMMFAPVRTGRRWHAVGTRGLRSQEACEGRPKRQTRTIRRVADAVEVIMRLLKPLTAVDGGMRLLLCSRGGADLDSSAVMLWLVALAKAGMSLARSHVTPDELSSFR